mmetsp:Transcript_10201/g.14420  ORF Transcript_10201/g.14420 Transcript_10201/m.14420 type:complete len:81 (+) Transcript_10201:165-407(+)
MNANLDNKHISMSTSSVPRMMPSISLKASVNPSSSLPTVNHSTKPSLIPATTTIIPSRIAITSSFFNFIPPLQPIVHQFC